MNEHAGDVRMKEWYEKNAQGNYLPLSWTFVSTSYQHGVLNGHCCLNHIFSSSFPAGENYSLYHFYGTFHWSDKVIRRSHFKCLSGASTDLEGQMLLKAAGRPRQNHRCWWHVWRLRAIRLQSRFHSQGTDSLSWLPWLASSSVSLAPDRIAKRAVTE